MQYDYSGYLKTIIHAPDLPLRSKLEYVEFTADDIAHWNCQDDPADRAWVGIPAEVKRTKEGVLLRGHFEEVRRIDNVRDLSPTFWAPLGTRGLNDGRFPIDLKRFPIMEITYRSVSPKAMPAWCWEYPGGMHQDGLTPSKDWRTIVRLASHNGFPETVTGLCIRLYSASRTTEEIEIQSIRFRVMSGTEWEACEKHRKSLKKSFEAPRYEALNDFLPFGVTMNVRSARDMADALGISLHDYWRISFEDIARHSHNAVALYNVELLSKTEFRDALSMAEFFNLRIVANLDWDLDDFDEKQCALVEEQIKPFSNVGSLLGWCLQLNPSDHNFPNMLKAQKCIQEAAPGQPVAYMTRNPNSFPLMAPHFPVSAMAYFKSNAAWELGNMVSAHLPLCGGQQFWIVAPTHVFASNTPTWNTCPEIRLLLNNAFSNGARGWFAHTYHNNPIWLNGNYQNSLTGPFLTFSDVWAELGHRVERFNALAPLFLNGKPVEQVDIPVEVESKKHPRSKLDAELPVVQYKWLQGDNYYLFYLINNDIGEVTSVNLRFPEKLPGSMQLFDVTDFVRTRRWAPSRHERHLEMFPGQGQMILLAEPEAYVELRDAMALRTLDNDKRLVSIDLSLARRYNLNVDEAVKLVLSLGHGKPMDDLLQMLEVRNFLLNEIYSDDRIVESRSKLIQASAIICGCDTLLSEMMGSGKTDLAYEMGLRIIPLANTMTNLRLKLRRGHGPEITETCENVMKSSYALLQEIQKISHK